MLKRAFQQGQRTALNRFKLAGPLGAEPPPGAVDAHGTNFKLPYPGRHANPAPGDAYDSAARARSEDLVDRLWHYHDVDHLAPGSPSGYGSEVIG